MSAIHNEQRPDPGLKAGIVRRMVQVFIIVAFQAAILFLSSGQLNWVWAWVYIGIHLVGISINASIMLRYSPETIAERSRTGENVKDWDKIIGGLAGVMYFVILLLVAGLDVRFGWTGPIALALQIAGTVVFVLGGALFSWAMISNTYFSTVVRIQDDRGHAVCSTGPYRFVRHPGYVGFIIMSLTAPLMFGSLWTFIPGGLTALLMVARTALEDQMLQEELDGYQEYAGRVRHRLLPGAW